MHLISLYFVVILIFFPSVPPAEEISFIEQPSFNDWNEGTQPNFSLCPAAILIWRQLQV